MQSANVCLGKQPELWNSRNDDPQVVAILRS